MNYYTLLALARMEEERKRMEALLQLQELSQRESAVQAIRNLPTGSQNLCVRLDSRGNPSEIEYLEPIGTIGGLCVVPSGEFVLGRALGLW